MSGIEKHMTVLEKRLPKLEHELRQVINAVNKLTDQITETRADIEILRDKMHGVDCK